MTLEDNKRLAVRLSELAFNERKLDEAIRLLAPDFRTHAGGQTRGPEGFTAIVDTFLKGFADFHGQPQHVLAEDDKVVVFTLWRGTHTGRFRGLAPTGKQVAFETVDLLRIAQGRIVEHWDVVDRLALQTTLGLIRPAA
ncbi:MAG TPA: ester cyclase [Vineibacter sp.]|nr:ester cyclase [Vineibacter sp.]